MEIDQLHSINIPTFLYCKIIGYLWADYIDSNHICCCKELKKWLISLSLVSWRFHQITSCFNHHLYCTSNRVLNDFIVNHFKYTLDINNDSSVKNKYAIFSNVRVFKYYGLLKEFKSLDILKIILPTITELWCGASELELASRYGATSIKTLITWIVAERKEEIEGLMNCSANLEHMNIDIRRETNVNQDVGSDYDSDLDFDDTDYSYVYDPLMRSLCSSHLSNTLKHLEVADSCNQGFSRYILVYGAIQFFGHLLKLSALESLKISLGIVCDLNEQQFTIFIQSLLCFLKQQRKLRCFNFIDPIPHQYGYLEYLLQDPQCNIEELHISLCQSVPMKRLIKRLHIYELPLLCDNQTTIESLSMAESLTFYYYNQSIFKDVSVILHDETYPFLKSIDLGHLSNPKLKVTLPVEFIDSLSNNNNLEYFTFRYKLESSEQRTQIDQIVRDHKSIRNRYWQKLHVHK